MQFKIILFSISLVILLSGCQRYGGDGAKIFSDLQKDTSIRYAKRFAVYNGQNYKVIYLFGNKNNFDTTGIYIVTEDTSGFGKLPEHVQLVKVPCKRVATLSSIYTTVLCELGDLDRIVAVDNMDYTNNPDIIEKFKRGEIVELAKTPKVDLEKTVSLNPDMIFSFGMGNPEEDMDPKLVQAKIPIAIALDHKEEKIFARAEWIKFFGIFMKKEKQADSIFRKVEKNYLELKRISEKVAVKPTVFNEIKYGDTWYVPGGNSYMAELLRDAGADYLWKEDKSYGSFPLSFEQVYVKAKDGDYWINLALIRSKEEMLAFDKRYSEFKAFKTGNLYNNTKITNDKGYSIYWETGMIHPDRILSDLVQIFHPELKSQVKNDLYYYEQIK
jgi:iron complex transport system substrate-binding protein